MTGPWLWTERKIQILKLYNICTFVNMFEVQHPSFETKSMFTSSSWEGLTIEKASLRNQYIYIYTLFTYLHQYRIVHWPSKFGSAQVFHRVPLCLTWLLQSQSQRSAMTCRRCRRGSRFVRNPAGYNRLFVSCRWRFPFKIENWLIVSIPMIQWCLGAGKIPWSEQDVATWLNCFIPRLVTW